ncbi:toll/interleukin-1 receptor domain-containing protein [Pseudomonas sp. BGr12]|uniref:toll/interleukin-1 receptor domain-containing protein n=1 Tax=Pseudomonas sp. BGr12 TaxID=2936269 RepID=UPI002559A97B|nr:toll/interleukin-1 receptor domain-containing protein [Pseudomonas sp. BJa5]MDL2428423.1 toll/interleukin-1 receptor domain-containing protein [Pseudomonas sp. BJa5]
MPIFQSVLNNAWVRRTQRGISSRRTNQPTAFLSHSHKDSSLALGLQQMLNEQGWDIYIDWQDLTMPAEPDEQTATRIKRAIEISDWFLFLATDNSMSSRWCPWEIGYADGTKQISRIAIIPTIDASGRYHGNEYLKLYPRIEEASSGGLALFPVTGNGRWIRTL